MNHPLQFFALVPLLVAVLSGTGCTSVAQLDHLPLGAAKGKVTLVLKSGDLIVHFPIYQEINGQPKRLGALRSLASPLGAVDIGENLKITTTALPGIATFFAGGNKIPFAVNVAENLTTPVTIELVFVSSDNSRNTYKIVPHVGNPGDPEPETPPKMKFSR